MAYKDSGEIATNSNYALGDYSFRIERSSVPGSTNDKIEAICTDKDGHNARKSIQVPSNTQLNGWYVEANETEATVYANILEPDASSELDCSPLSKPFAVGSVSSAKVGASEYTSSGEYFTSGQTLTQSTYLTVYSGFFMWASKNPFDMIRPSDGQVYHSRSFIYKDKTVYYNEIHGDSFPPGFVPSLNEIANYSVPKVENIAWTMVYGDQSGGKIKEVLVGRFAIDIEDADGVGPGSDWTDPGDYDPDWEEGDPTHTLYVTVTGALSGRHNDPIVDPSYSYIPSDKDTVKGYGCGGDGGNGGGGGAGASTVVVHKFATNQANSKEVTAIARRHGYGSGGGKGGKGGDGCILVYY